MAFSFSSNRWSSAFFSDSKSTRSGVAGLEIGASALDARLADGMGVSGTGLPSREGDSAYNPSN